MSWACPYVYTFLPLPPLLELVSEPRLQPKLIVFTNQNTANVAIVATVAVVAVVAIVAITLVLLSSPASPASLASPASQRAQRPQRIVKLVGDDGDDGDDLTAILRCWVHSPCSKNGYTRYQLTSPACRFYRRQV